MAVDWAQPQYSKGDVDEAGQVLIDPDPNVDDLVDAFAIVNNWRSSHSYPLNTFQINLRHAVARLSVPGLVSQRIKRLPAIRLKLKLQKTMKLSQMQDIGGCRAVVPSVPRVRDLVADVRSSRVKHELLKVTDYIESPRSTGYRSVHLMYKHYSGRKGRAVYNGLRIEMQIRSRLQHAWATAVETVGDFISQALKSNQGDAEWRRFFALMSAMIALNERTEPVPGTPTTRKELAGELRVMAKALDVEGTFKRIGKVVEVRERIADAHYFLIASDPTTRRVRVEGFPIEESEQALQRYSDTEKAFANIPGAQTVLVSVDSVNKLRRAYPSYYLDTQVFLAEMKKAIREK